MTNRLFLPMIYFTCVMMFFGCDKEPSEAPPAAAVEDGPITAKAAATPIEPGTSLKVTIDAVSVIPTPPSSRMKKQGVFRPVDVETKVSTTFFVELVQREGGLARWRFDFESFEQVTKNGSTEAKSTYDLAGESLMVELGEETQTVTNKAGDPATESQTRLARSLARSFEQRDEWRAFFGSRDFEQGKIVEAPSGLYLGDVLEFLLGDVRESHTTASLFRLGLVDESEVAHIDVNSNVQIDFEGADYGDISQSGRAVVRLGDGVLLDYDMEGKVVPRAATGEMMPSGSGTWKIEYRVDPASIRKPE